MVSLSAARTAVHHAALPSAGRNGRACHPLTLKEQFIHSNPVESLQNAMRVSADKICFFNNRRPHQARGMKTRVQAYKVVAWLQWCQIRHCTAILHGKFDGHPRPAIDKLMSLRFKTGSIIVETELGAALTERATTEWNITIEPPCRNICFWEIVAVRCKN